MPKLAGGQGSERAGAGVEQDEVAGEFVFEEFGFELDVGLPVFGKNGRHRLGDVAEGADEGEGQIDAVETVGGGGEGGVGEEVSPFPGVTAAEAQAEGCAGGEGNDS